MLPTMDAQTSAHTKPWSLRWQWSWKSAQRIWRMVWSGQWVSEEIGLPTSIRTNDTPFLIYYSLSSLALSNSLPHPFFSLSYIVRWVVCSWILVLSPSLFLLLSLSLSLNLLSLSLHMHRKIQFVIPAFGEFNVDVFALCSCTCEQNQVWYMVRHTLAHIQKQKPSRKITV